MISRLWELYPLDTGLIELSTRRCCTYFTLQRVINVFENKQGAYIRYWLKFYQQLLLSRCVLTLQLLNSNLRLALNYRKRHFCHFLFRPMNSRPEIHQSIACQNTIQAVSANHHSLPQYHGRHWSFASRGRCRRGVGGGGRSVNKTNIVLGNPHNPRHGAW